MNGKFRVWDEVAKKMYYPGDVDKYKNKKRKYIGDVHPLDRHLLILDGIGRDKRFKKSYYMICVGSGGREACCRIFERVRRSMS